MKTATPVPVVDAATDGAATEARVVYIIGTYPQLTTTFIDREVRMLRGRGTTVDLVSLRHPPDNLGPDQAALASATTYIRPIRPGLLALRHARFIARRPLRYLTTLLRLAAGSGQSTMQRLRTIGHFVLAVYVTGELVEAHGAPDRIHAHFIDRAATVANVASRLLDVPYSITAHASDIYVDPVLLHRKIDDADFVTTCTAYNHRHLAETVPGANDKVEVMYHGLELVQYRPPGAEATGAPKLLAVGQLKEKKGFADLLRACRLLVDRGVDFECEIVGEGPQRNELQELVTALELEGRVALRGALPHRDVIDAYARAYAFVLPCVVAENGDRDGIPNVILEAMAMQLPVVSTAHSGIPEAVEHQRTGLLVPPREAGALADALAALLEDPTLAHQLGAEGRQVVRTRFDAAANAAILDARFGVGQEAP